MATIPAATAHIYIYIYTVYAVELKTGPRFGDFWR